MGEETIAHNFSNILYFKNVKKTFYGCEGGYSTLNSPSFYAYDSVHPSVSFTIFGSSYEVGINSIVAVISMEQSYFTIINK